MITLLCIAGYIAMILGFCLWDSLIGMPVKRWDYNDAPPLGLAAFFWPISIPIVLIMAFNNYLDSAKAKRFEQENQKQRLRIAAQKEIDSAMEQVEAEIKTIISGAKK